MIALRALIENKQFSIKETAIVNYIIRHINSLHDIGIDDIAKNAKVGYSTIYNLMKKLGYKNFNMFMAEIIHSQAITGEKAVSLDGEYNSIINRAAVSVDDAAVDRFVDLINSAQNVYLLGFGKSYLAAQKFAYDLYLRNFKAVCISTSDVHNIDVLTKKLQLHDLLICFSLTGKTKLIVESMQAAFENGCPTVLFTANPAGPAMNYSTITLATLNIDTYPKHFYINRNLSFLFLTDYIYNRMVYNDNCEIDHKEVEESEEGQD